jgi:hypothetical protein
MNTWKWEDEPLFDINRELQQLLNDKIVNTVISMSLVAVDDPKSAMSKYSAILIYK